MIIREMVREIVNREEIQNKMINEINNAITVGTQFAIAIDSACHREDYTGDYCVFCLSQIVTPNHEIHHHNDCVVLLAKQWLRENKKEITK